MRGAACACDGAHGTAGVLAGHLSGMSVKKIMATQLDIICNDILDFFDYSHDDFGGDSGVMSKREHGSVLM